MAEPWRKISKRQSIIINMPFYKEVLEPEFSYKVFAEEMVEDTLASQKGIFQRHMEGCTDEILKDFFNSPSSKPETPVEKLYQRLNGKLSNYYETSIFAFQRKFEVGLTESNENVDTLDKNITVAMKVVTLEYLKNKKYLDNLFGSPSTLEVNEKELTDEYIQLLAKFINEPAEENPTETLTITDLNNSDDGKLAEKPINDIINAHHEMSEVTVKLPSIPFLDFTTEQETVHSK